MTGRKTLDQLTSDELDALHDRLDRAETFVTTVADIIADHEGDEWGQHPATTAIRRGFGTVPHAVRDTELRRQLDAAIKALGASETELAELRQRFTTQAIAGSELAVQLGAVKAALREAINALVHNGDTPPTEADVDRWRAALDEPAPARPAGTLRRTVPAQVDTHTWIGDLDAVTAWLAGHPHHWTDGQLVIDTIDGPVPVPHGWLLARWPDGDVTVMSPRAAAKRLQAAEPAADPNPPGSTREQLPNHILDTIRDRLPDYTSTACQTADTAACAVGQNPGMYDELRAHAERLHNRCRLNHKFTGQLCACGCHLTVEES